MKIALLAPPWIPLPPQGYGGIENVVFNLAEGLTKKGHEVIVCTTGDSKVSGQLIYFYKNSLGIDTLLEERHSLLFLNHIYYSLESLPSNIDIIHNNCEYYAIHLLAKEKVPVVHTLHGSFMPDNNNPLKKTGSTNSYLQTLDLFKDNFFVSISDFQRNGKKDLNYVSTVYNGINVNDFKFYESTSDYLSWLGRYSPIKGLDVAISLAKTIGKKLILSVSIHAQRQQEFDQTIKPKIDNENIILTGKKDTSLEKSEFLGRSKAFLFPIQWEEPFGLVMIEAMATGTPVIAFARGSVPEVIKDGKTGFLVNSSDQDIRGDWIIKKTGIEGLKEAVEKIYNLPSEEYLKMRNACRAHVEQNFSVEKMVDAYEEAYKKVLQK